MSAPHEAVNHVLMFIALYIFFSIAENPSDTGHRYSVIMMFHLKKLQGTFPIVLRLEAPVEKSGGVSTIITAKSKEKSPPASF